MSSNLITSDSSEKRISLVYNSEISGFQALDFGKLNNLEDILISFSGDGAQISGIHKAITNNYTAYNTLELFYDGSNNNTGVYYKTNNSTTRILAMEYDGSNNLTKVTKIDL